MKIYDQKHIGVKALAKRLGCSPDTVRRKNLHKLIRHSLKGSRRVYSESAILVFLDGVTK